MVKTSQLSHDRIGLILGIGELALSSSTVEALRVSRVTSTANCFLVPLSRSEWAKTIAPVITGQTWAIQFDMDRLAWQVRIAREEL